MKKVTKLRKCVRFTFTAMGITACDSRELKKAYKASKIILSLKTFTLNRFGHLCNRKKKKPRDVGKYKKSLTIHTLYTSKTCSKNMLCPFLVIRAKGEKRNIITCLTLEQYLVSLTWMKTFFKLWVSKFTFTFKNTLFTELYCCTDTNKISM